MTDSILARLMPALDIAVFERNGDGSFRALAEPPAWFGGLGRSGTFPFLGHILDEANVFWATRADGVREWGPCVETSERGEEFHYKVKALTLGASQCLVFELDVAAERMREVLQKVRSDALESERRRRASARPPDYEA